MTVQKWLSDVYYDEWGTHIWNKVDEDGGSQLIADVRGWGAIQNLFKTNEEAEQFQDQVGKFIVEAIKEKIARTSKTTTSQLPGVNVNDVKPSNPQMVNESFNPKAANQRMYNEEQLKLAYMQGYNRGVLGTGHNMESYIEFIKQPKKD